MPNDSAQQPEPLEKSLGEQATGSDVSRVAPERSLGDHSTSGDALSSMSDLVDDRGEAIDSDLPLIDLAARYQIEGELGQGGMGAVLLATDRQLKRKVAIKRIHTSMAKSKPALQRFVTEAQSIAALNHFNIVQIYEFGRDAEGPLLVLEYVSGGSLLDKLKEGKLEAEEAVDITCQLCDAVAKAHGAGIIHRDIKPANILLTEDGAPKLTDFGLARQETTDHGQTQAGAVLGTIDFMPPEQRRDATAADARSDLWSLAATTYQMITGKSPRIINFTNVPQIFQDVLQKALEEEQTDRYQTAQGFRDALRGSLATTTESIPDVSVDLLTGECGECHSKNDFSRKFCSECAAPLRVACLKCEEDIPIWDKVCGECGGKQPELIAAHRSKLSSILETSLTLAREHEYEKSLSQLEIVTGDKHASTEDLGQQAAKQIDVVTTQRDEQHQLRDQLVALADRHHHNHDYAAEIQELEKIPLPLRTGNKIAQQLSNAQAANDELDTLEGEIRSDVKNKQIDGLLEKVTHFLKLNPMHEKIRNLQQQLLQREQKAIAVALKKKNYLRVLELDPTNTEALKMKTMDDNYSIHTAKIFDEIIHVGDGKFAGVDISWNIDESIDEHYTQILFLIQELGYPVDLESVRFTKDELIDYYKKEMLAYKDQLIFDEDFFDAFPDRINYFIRNYCSLVNKATSHEKNTLGMEFKLIPAGDFLMGSPISCPLGDIDEELQHRVRLTKPFLIGIHQVTQAQYMHVTGMNPSLFRGAEHPVEHLSWQEARDFCKRLSALPEEEVAGRRYRLPTEAEWEYACRAGTSTPYNTGEKLGIRDACFAGERRGSPKQTRPVGTYPPNNWGLFDMHGNVWEWTNDWYSADWYLESPVEDPQGPASGTHHTLRGGSASVESHECRSAIRGEAVNDKPDNSSLAQRYTYYGDFGVRVVCELD